MTKMESTGEVYKCDKCGYTWEHEDDACPNCGSDLYIIPIGCSHRKDRHKQSIELLDKFLRETPPEQLNELIKKYDEMEIEGPTLTEYLSQFGNNIDIQRLQDEVKKWSDGVFGMYRNGIPIIYHLKGEVDELIEALKNNHKGIYGNTDETALKRFRESKDKILMEFADCFMLLIDAAAHEQITIDMLVNATKRKLEINKARKWGAANEFGYHEHLKE